MNILQSNFDYGIADCFGKVVLWITDRKTGNKSVTNDMENVVAFLTTKLMLDPAQCLILYRDSEDNWDGWSGEYNYFIPLTETIFEIALLKLFKITRDGR